MVLYYDTCLTVAVHHAATAVHLVEVPLPFIFVDAIAESVGASAVALALMKRGRGGDCETNETSK